MPSGVPSEVTGKVAKLQEQISSKLGQVGQVAVRQARQARVRAWPWWPALLIFRLRLTFVD